MCRKYDKRFRRFCMTCTKPICSHSDVPEHSEYKVFSLIFDEKKDYLKIFENLQWALNIPVANWETCYIWRLKFPKILR
ncbi:hypothetical protein LSH36_174g01069 [Paralvinella palmiformis]|uniref:Uncharacterized protein n=1 Tax=Paralvinella palmiformis TaxID=53620 RepID=A0AAD9JRW5_9ANNE|nr:hypothetical protein LSH36_174g01069 [Paralvinella palmiformis]